MCALYWNAYFSFTFFMQLATSLDTQPHTHVCEIHWTCIETEAALTKTEMSYKGSVNFLQNSLLVIQNTNSHELSTGRSTNENLLQNGVKLRRRNSDNFFYVLHVRWLVYLKNKEKTKRAASGEFEAYTILFFAKYRVLVKIIWNLLI